MRAVLPLALLLGAGGLYAQPTQPKVLATRAGRGSNSSSAAVRSASTTGRRYPPG
jgi:hypothetical protein